MALDERKVNVFIVTCGKKERVGVEDWYLEQRALSHGCSLYKVDGEVTG